MARPAKAMAMNTPLAKAMPRQAPLAMRQPAATEVRATRKKSGPGESRARKWAKATIRNCSMVGCLVRKTAVWRLPWPGY